MTRHQGSATAGFRSVVCAIDFSPQSTAVLRVAATIAAKSGGHVSALCVEDPLLGEGAASVGYDTSLLRKTTLTQLRRLVRRVIAGTKLADDAWSVHSTLGHPAPAIVAFARRMDADLIVMGTHGRRGAARLFFGSTAIAVLRRAPVPVLVIPRMPRRGGRHDVELTRAILGAVELGGNDTRDVRRMARTAAMFNAPLTLLHVVPIIPGPPWFAARLEQPDRDRLVAARARLHVLAESVNARSRVVLGRVNEEIPAAAVDAKAGMTILVLRRGHGLFGTRQGTITYQVLCGSPTPVLALPPHL